MDWIFAQQAEFFRALSGAIRAAKADGSAVWMLFAISFAYGVFHAAGPGHGKAVISSYLVANGETWRRGIVLSFASALLQSLVAVLLVAILAALLGVTSKVIGDTVRWVEIVSYAMVAALGARLLWVKGRAFVAALRRAPHAHAHAHHGHSHAAHDHSSCDHTHGPDPKDLTGPHWFTRGLSAIVAVGLRPCSGAIIVLVFAMAQGMFIPGVVAVFVMGMGTAITVAMIATIAVMARDAAKRLSQSKSGAGILVMRGIEVGAAALVLAFGVLLLTGYLASERLGF